MPKNKKIKENNHLEIRNIPRETLEPLNNIAKHLGVTMTEFLKPHMRKIIDKYPEYKNSKSNKQCARVVLTNVTPKLVEELFNVSDNLGVGYSSFLKVELKSIKDQYPDHMTKPPVNF